MSEPTFLARCQCGWTGTAPCIVRPSTEFPPCPECGTLLPAVVVPAPPEAIALGQELAERYGW